MSLRSDLGRVRGLGSAKEGVSHWRWQRITALALIPLSLWLMTALLGMVGADYAQVVAWIRSPLVTVLLLALTGALFYHLLLGVQVVIEDYVHSQWLQIAAQFALRLGVTLCALLAAVSILKISVGLS